MHRKNRTVHAGFLSASTAITGVSALVVSFSGVAADQAGDFDVEEVTVTASRVSVGGFRAPTPTSVLGPEDFERVAAVQVGEILDQLPTFRRSATTSTPTTYANLRSIGAQRTLVLVDGRRHVPTFSDGTLDLSVIPSALLDRVEAVTGGASASWGSDAVAGVVNLILNDDLEGLIGNAQYGRSKYDDDETVQGSFALGHRFADDRAHILFAAEYAEEDGVRGLAPPFFSRPWAGRGFLGNPDFATNGQPGTIYSRDQRPANYSAGGLITAGPLRGTQFNNDGTTSQFQYGTVYGNDMIGGGDNFGLGSGTGEDLKFPLQRYNAFARLTYDVTDRFNVFVESNYARSISEGLTNLAQNQGSSTQPTCSNTTLTSRSGGFNVSIDNAFLSESVRNQMLSAGIDCFAMGKVYYAPGMGQLRTETGIPSLWRGATGFEGSLGMDWKVEGYVAYGHSQFRNNRKNNINTQKFRNAIDAVRNGAGEIVCRINIDALSANDDPSCVPFNLFGPTSASGAAVAYVTQLSSFEMDTYQTAAALSVQGPLFSTWAGPIGAAFGLEYRREKVDAVADPISLANGFLFANRKSIAGSYDVNEAFAEFAVPLAADLPLLQALDLNLAARYADYSSSGGVTTWKAGIAWDMTDEWRVRATRSRDIRAGNLGELYTPTAVSTVIVTDPRTAATVLPSGVTLGNPTLDPEVADTLTAGVVYQPAWAEGLRMSVDYYDIDINDVIGSITAQQVLNRCYLDQVARFCADVDVDSFGTITEVRTRFQNLNRLETNGVDVALSYRSEAARLFSRLPGDISVNLFGTYVDELALTATLNGTRVDPIGQYSNPNWTAFGTLGYHRDTWGVSIEEQYFQGGTIDNRKVQGEISARGANINHVPATWYTHLAAHYRFDSPGGADMQLYARVNNVFDREPPFPSPNVEAANDVGVVMFGGDFDQVGRAYRIGLKVSF